MPRTTPSRMRRLRAIASSSTASGAKAPDGVVACSGGLKPAPTRLAEGRSSDALRDRRDVSGDPPEAAGFVGRGFSRDISADTTEGALAPGALEVIGPNRSESSRAIGRAPIVK